STLTRAAGRPPTTRDAARSAAGDRRVGGRAGALPDTREDADGTFSPPGASPSSTAAITSATEMAGRAPSRNNALVPVDTPLKMGPGTANSNRPCARAYSAVSNAP